MSQTTEVTGIAVDLNNIPIADRLRTRKCVCCARMYSVESYRETSANYFHGGYQYANGCWTHCLDCWLDVGPELDPENDDSECNLLRDCGPWLGPWTHLAIMPIARTTLDSPIRLSGRVRMYPAGAARLDALNVVPNEEKTASLAELSSALSRVDQKMIGMHVTIAFPVTFDWDRLWSTGHKNHMEFVRLLSETADKRCLNVIRYKQCEIGDANDLPGRAGQLDSNHMMAGALLYNPVIQKARIIGGAAFTHIATKGLGLPISMLEDDDFPQEGEVGNIVDHALSLYTSLLETENETSKFVQALSLLEFLADPDSYTKFSEVKRIVARYVAKSPATYDLLLRRFDELTSKKDEKTGAVVGYRTRIVHIGDRLNDLVQGTEERRRLFEELDGYIRPIMDHMIVHSVFSYADYLKIRDQMRPFENCEF